MYSMPNNRRDVFQRDGYIVLHAMVDTAEVDDIRHQIDRFIAEVVPLSSETLAFYEIVDEPTSIMRLQNMQLHNDYFRQLFEDERFVDLAAELLGEEVTGRNLQWFNKPPRVANLTPPHQDGFYFMLEPNEAVTLWLALDEADEGNGCIRYVKGSAQRGMRTHQRSDIIGFSQGITDYGDADLEAEVPIIASPGDMFAHHCMTIHRADGNPSERARAALGLVYDAASSTYDEEKAQAYREQLWNGWRKEGKL